MTKTRTRKPAVGTASASVSTYETCNDRYISTDSARYGTTEVARSSRLRPSRGRAYGARVSFQVAALMGLPPRGTSVCPARPPLGEVDDSTVAGRFRMIVA